MLLTITQAAARLGVNQATLRRWADSGRVPHVVTFGGQRRFEADVIERVRRDMGFGDDRDLGIPGDVLAKAGVTIAGPESGRYDEHGDRIEGVDDAALD